MADGDLKAIADGILARLPEGAIAQSLAHWLREPNSKRLSKAGEGLLEAGHIDLAESLYRAMADRPNIDCWPRHGLAQVASKRNRPEEMVTAWSECLSQCSDHAKPYWFFELARAERKRENAPAALEYLRKGIERFPESVRLLAALPPVLSSLGRIEESIETSQTLFRRFASKAKRDWFVNFASALHAAGRFDDEKRVIEELETRFPDDPEGVAHQAQRAARAQNWTGANDLFVKYLERNSTPANPQWLNSRAMALFRVGKPEEALEVWSDLIRSFPDHVPAHVDLAGANQELGRWESAYQIWSDLLRSWPEQATQQWYFQRAVCLLNRPLAGSIEAAISELEARFPESSYGRRVAVTLSNLKSDGLAAHAAVVENAIARYPSDPQIQTHQIRYLLSAGRSADADRAVEQLEAVAGELTTTLYRWLVLMARNDETQVRAQAQQIVPQRAWTLGEGLRICKFLQSVVSPWATELALSLSDDLDRRFPRRIELVCMRSCLLIALHRYEEALLLVDTIPLAYETEDVLELRAWAAVRRGDLQSARTSWNTILDNYHYPALHNPEPNLDLLTPQWAQTRDAITLFTPVHNELTNLPHFLDHYRRLGVQRFVIVDNSSSDGTGDYLCEQSDVIHYRTHDNFAASGSGMRWMNFLMDRHGGEWCLYVDADEELIYPGFETVSLARLTEYLDAQGAEAMAGFMLDVYPERLFDDAGRPATRTDCRYYDFDYRVSGHSRCPYIKPDGGVRARLFGTKEVLHKVPLIKRGAGVYLMSHETTPLKLADVTGVLLHYNITDLPAKIAKMKCAEAAGPAATDRKPGVMRRYEQYAAQLDMMAGIDLRYPGVSHELAPSLELADRGVMQAPPEFRSWLGERSRGLGSCEAK